METLEMLNVFGVTHFYDVATEGQLRELADMLAEAQVISSICAEAAEIDTCEANDFGV